MTDLGEFLKKERERKNFSIEDIADVTHINPRTLRAMEKGDFKEIPGVFYTKNFLKTYLDAVGADQEEFFTKFQTDIDRVLDEKRDDPVQYYSKLRYSSFKRRNLYITASIILILIVSAFCFFYKSRDDLFQVIDFSEKKTEQTPRSYMDASFLKKTIISDRSPDYWPLNARIEFKEACWIQVLRGGRVVASGVFQPGDIQTFHGYNLNLTLGNPSGLRLFVNEKEITRFKNMNRSVKIQLNLTTLEGLIDNE